MKSLNNILSNPDQLFSVSQIAEACGVSRQAVDYWITDHNLKYVEIDNKREIKGEWLYQHLIKKGEIARKDYQQEFENLEKARALHKANFFMGGVGHFDLDEEEVATVLRLLDEEKFEELKKYYQKLSTNKLG